MNWIAGYKQHYKALIFLGLPIVIGQVGVIILGFADTLMIGHHSTEELGAASFVNNVFTLCIIFSTGFSYGLTPIVGSLYGNRRFAEAGQALRCSLVANVLVALLLTFIMTVVYFNVERLGQPEELNKTLLPGIACFAGFRDAVQRLQAVYGRNHRYEDRHVDIAGRKYAEHHRQLYPYQRQTGLPGAGVAGSRHQYVVLAYYDGGGVRVDCAARPPLYPLPDRVLPHGMVASGVQETQCTGLACRFADGNGDGLFQP